MSRLGFFYLLMLPYALNAQAPEFAFQLGHNARVTVLKTNSTFSTLFSCSSDGNIAAWDLGSGRQIRLFSYPGRVANDIFYREKENVLDIVYDHEIKTVSMVTGKEINSVGFDPKNQLMNVTMTDDNHFIVAGEAEVYRCDHNFTVQSSYNYFAQSDTTRAFDKIIKVVGSRQDKQVHLGTAEKEGKNNNKKTSIGGISLSPDKKSVIINVYFYEYSSLTGFYTFSTDSLRKIAFTGFEKPAETVFTNDNRYFYSVNQVRNAVNKRRLESLLHKPLVVYPSSATRNLISCIAANNQYVCYGDVSGVIAVCHSDRKDKKYLLKAREIAVTSLCISPDGKHLLSGDDEGIIFLWDLQTGKLVNHLKGIAKPVNSIKYNDAGNLLVIGYDDGEIKTWNVIENTFQRLTLTGVKGRNYKWSIIKINRIDSDSVIGFKCIAYEDDDYYIYNAKWNTSTNALSLAEVSFNEGKPAFTDSASCVTLNGDTVVSTGTRLRVKQGNGWKEFASGHTGNINEIAWNKKFNFFTTAGNDGLMISRTMHNEKELFTSGCLGNKGFFYVLPNGYYYVDKHSLKYLSFRINEKIYPFEQFDLKFNRPDLVVQQFPFANSLLVLNYQKAYEKRRKRSVASVDDINLVDDLPELHIVQDKSITGGAKYNLNVFVKGKQSLLNTIYVEVNGVPEPAYRISPTLAGAFNIPVELSDGMNKITASVQNDKGILSLKTEVTVKNPVKAGKPDLYLVTIGSGEFRDTTMNLAYANKDAHDIAAYFSKDRHYSKIKKHDYTGQKFSRESLKEIKKVLDEAKPSDMVLIFYAGHGLLDRKFDYYLSTYNTDFIEPEKNAVLYSDLESVIASCKSRKKLLLLDACHSGEIDKESATVDKDGLKIVYGDITFRGFQTLLESNKAFELSKILFADVDKNVGAAVISSSGGSELSLEGKKWNNGVFTHVVLRGLKSKKADLNGDGNTNVSELLFYVNENVKMLTGGKQTPTSRVENIYYDFRVK
ncbi:MAG TPA: caspase family protein [Flavobacteriales bacterium]|nr:caspase family protein [Flavobacteriales bacterium]